MVSLIIAFPSIQAWQLHHPEPEAGRAENGIFQVWEIFESLRIDTDLRGYRLSALPDRSG